MHASLVVFALFLMTSCSTDNLSQPPAAESSTLNQVDAQPVVSASAPPDTGEPAMHAVHNTRLKRVMSEINSLVYEQMQNEVDLSQERALKTREIAKIAHELTKAKQAILKTVPSLTLTPEEVNTFTAIAEKLDTNARQMEAVANKNQLADIPAQMQAITSTCNSCHSLFRKTPNILERCRDPRHTC